MCCTFFGKENGGQLDRCRLFVRVFSSIMPRKMTVDDEWKKWEFRAQSYPVIKGANPGRKEAFFALYAVQNKRVMYYPTHISKAAQSAFFVRSAPRGEGGRSRYGHPRMGVKVRCFINYFCCPFMQQYYQACFCLAFRQNIYSP